VTRKILFNPDKIQAVVDLGGSGLQVYRKTVDSTYRLTVDLEITSDSSSINEWLCSHVLRLTADCQHIILGIPGPVEEQLEDVYCPPLDASIALNIYRAKGIYIVNDTIAHLLICWDKTMASSREGSIITVGTSLGLCTYRTDNKTGLLDMAKVTSHEIAHDMTENYRRQIHPHVFPSSPTTLGAVFSMAALAILFNRTTTPIANNLSRVSKEVTKTIIADLVNSEIFVQWLESLNMCVISYLNGKSLQSYAHQMFISGGLAVVVSEEARLRDTVKRAGFILLKRH